jgi:thioredoxin reductase
LKQITRLGNEFSAACDDGTVTARKVLLATGLKDVLPQLNGIEPLYGRSVHHCPYCDGFEHRDQPLAVYGAADKGDAGLALMMKLWSSDVVGNLHTVHLQSGQAPKRSAMFFTTGCVQNSDLSASLGCIRDAKGGVIGRRPTEESSIDGVYVAGDASRDVLLVAVAIA